MLTICRSRHILDIDTSTDQKQQNIMIEILSAVGVYEKMISLPKKSTFYLQDDVMTQDIL